MNLVKWLRKNNRKVMAIVVIVIMFGFIGSDYLQWLGQGRTRRQTFAYFLDNKKITNDDLVVARRELEILRALRADDFLRAQDLGGIFLAELLFSERRASPELINHIKRAILTNNYRVSDKQVSDLYARPQPGYVYWLLLKTEVEQAGIRFSNAEVGNLLGQAIPQLFKDKGLSYSQFVGSLIKQQGIPEEAILTTFGKLLTILQYAHMLCSSENVTGSQVMHMASWENETINVEFVKFDSAVFAESQDQPAEEKMLEHFDKYKKFFLGTETEENPYGFGYKLPDRVQLEYIALKLSDISPTVTPPTQEETEEFYRKNRDEFFSEQVPSDPNDPNSLLIKRTRSYTEVANIISKQLLQNKIISKAEKILQEAGTITEANWKDTERAKVSSEQLKAMAGDYKAAARQLSEKYKIRIYAGQTGLLSAVDMQTDEYLATLYLEGAGYNRIRLTQVVFAVNELAASQLGLYDVPKPRLYENIGPVTNPFGQMLKTSPEQIMVLVRVIQAVKASEPETINQTFSTKTLEFQSKQESNEADPNSSKEHAETGHIYSVKEKVAEDLKKLAAMDTTKTKAEEFVALATKDSWDIALDKFNELYRPAKGRQNESDSNAFSLRNLSNLRRLSTAALQTLAVQNSGSPLAGLLANDLKRQAQLIAKLYSLVPPDSNTPAVMPLIIESKPDMSFYCLKKLSVNRLWLEDYEKIMARHLFREDYAQAQSLTAVHFNPENILKRMNFREIGEDKKTPDANAPAEPEPVTDS